ncbi:MAG TPA: FixG Ig-like domain-containing protein, partial [Mariniflexile sp.]|nr:FixG Ig-like domain-containing protein [Mariniflexile sp.]
IVVAYDHKRGERDNGRKKWRKNEDRQALGFGDCIDCFQCVHVCPTGIDIRNGTQLECVNCTACIDECDSIMESVNLPKGLIRYASEDNIEKKEPFKLTARMKGYIAVLTILIGLLTGMLFLRNDVEATVLKLPGQLLEPKANNIISNVYTYKLVNKTTNNIENVSIKLLSHKGTLKLASSNNNFVVPSRGIAQGTLFVEINNAALSGDRNKIKIGIYANGELIETTTANFLGPRSYR